MAVHIAHDLQVDGDASVDGQIQSKKASGAPISVLSSEVNVNLNADMVDGIHANRMLFGDNARASLGGLNIDEVMKSGVYYASNGTRPDSQNGYALTIMHNANDNYFGQIYIPNSGTRQPAWRCKDNGTLSAWDKLITESVLNTRVSALGYITQTAGDARYAPIVHTQDMNTIVGLVTALNGKLSNSATITINGETKNLNTNPSFTITAGISQATADGRYGRLDADNTWTGAQTYNRGSSSGAATVISFRGTDYGTVTQHLLSIRKEANTSTYTILMSNGTTQAGSILNFALESLNYNGNRVATESWVNGQGYIPSSRSVSAGTGLSGGGSLSSNVTLSVSFGTESDQVARGNHTHSNYVPTSRGLSISVSDGLSISGTSATDLSVDRTWNIGVSGIAPSKITGGSNGQVLMSNGSYGYWANPSGGGTITGGGTSDRLTFWSGSSSIQASSNIYVSNNYISIGHNNTSTDSFGLRVSSLLIAGSLRVDSGFLLSETSSSYAGKSALAMLDVQSTSKGILIPRMTRTQRLDIVSPPNMLMVCQTDSVTGSNAGLYIYITSGWQRVTSA